MSRGGLYEAAASFAGQPYAHVFSLREGKVIRNENHHDTALWTTTLA